MKQCFGWLKRSVILTALAVVGMSVDARADESVWIGGASGDFSEASNWDPAIVPSTASQIAVFTNSATVSSSSNFVELHVRAGNLKLTKTGRLYLQTGNAKKEVVVNVATGATATLGTTDSNLWYGKETLTFVKDGGGKLTVARCIGYNTGFYKDVDIRGGTLHMEGNYGGLNISDPYVHIRSGATFEQKTYGQLSKQPVIEIDEGGTLDLGKLATTLRAVIGKGSIINNTKGLTLTLADATSLTGPYTFGGTFSGTITLAPTEYVAGTTKFILANPAALASSATLAISGEGFTLADVLAFKAGIGTIQLNDSTFEMVRSANLTYDDGTPLAISATFSSDYTHTTAGDDDWSAIPLVAKGNVTEKSGGTWTLGDITMTPGKTFTVSTGATGSSIHFKGGTMTNITFTAEKTDYDYWFDGVTFSSGSVFPANYDRIYHQTAGTVWLGGLDATDDGSAPHSTNEVFYYLSGGTLTSKPNAYYQCGIGLEASGESVAYLKNGTFKNASNPHVLMRSGSDQDYGYTLRAKDSAKIYVDDLNLYYYTGGTATGRIEVADQALLDINGILGSQAQYTAQAGYSCQLTFDGGTIRSSASGTLHWPNKFDDTSRTLFASTVKQGGITIDLPRANYSSILVWHGPFSSGVAEGVDGGLTKTGLGRLAIIGDVDLLGVVKLSEGALRVDRAQPADHGSLGFGGLTIERGLMEYAYRSSAYTLAASSGVVRATGPAAIRFDANNTKLTIGQEGSDTDAFAVGPHGSLAFVLGTAGPQKPTDSLTNYFIKVNGTLPAGKPIFAYYQPGSGAIASRRMGRYFYPVMKDAEGYLTNLAYDYTNEIPTEDTTGSFLISGGGKYKLSADRSVGFFAVYGGGYVKSDGSAETRRGGLQIMSGKTLTVGDGTTGCVVLNNDYAISESYGWARIFGAGTLDFGTAAGTIVASDCYDDATDSTYPAAALVDCKLAGTGGITFTSPATSESTLGASALNGGYMRAIHVGGDNTYSGGTYIDNMLVTPKLATAFGSGTVTIVGDANWGGELHFNKTTTDSIFTNALVVSGSGYKSTSSATRWGTRAAISAYNKAVTIKAPITLTADATIATSGDDGKITLTGAITGAGTLHVTAGTVVVRKDAVAAYDAGKIVADEGATIVVRRRQGFLSIIR